MDLARYAAMDAQRFDPLRRKKAPSSLTLTSIDQDMGQLLRRLSQPDISQRSVVGGIWSDHELVLVPLEVSSQRDSIGSVLAESFASTSSSESAASASSSTSATTYFTTSSPTVENETLTLTSSPPGTHRTDTLSDREDLIITRTIIRPTPHRPPVRGMFSRPSSPLVSSRPTSPLCRPNTPALRALNCFRPDAFDKELDDVQTDRARTTTQQVLQVIVTQTREQYEQDMAFKQVLQEVYPEAIGRRPAVH